MTFTVWPSLTGFRTDFHIMTFWFWYFITVCNSSSSIGLDSHFPSINFLNLLLLATFSTQVLIKLLDEDIAEHRTSFGLALTDRPTYTITGWLTSRIPSYSNVRINIISTKIYCCIFYTKLDRFPFHQNFRGLWPKLKVGPSLIIDFYCRCGPGFYFIYYSLYTYMA